jgi:Asp-tRNA(Asn)/Glu-tRNA(Gln) amidotransferase A subunit family amidase
MAAIDDYEDLDATALAERIRSGGATADEALDEALERVARWNPVVNAVVHVAADAARAAIRAGLPPGPFAGVPFLAKDLSLGVRGLPMTNGSRFWAGFVPDADTTLAERYRAAGLVFAGRTATPEMGLGPLTEPAATGPCRNPWDPTRQTGGSSGGAAAAVAARIVPVAHATDGGGSIRMPAAHCGVFGFKPSRARMPVGPALGEAWSGLAAPHVVSRTVRDSAALLDATAGPATGDPYAAPPIGSCLAALDRPPPRLRIAVSWSHPGGGTVDPEVAAAVAAVGRRLADLGHHVEEAPPPIDLDALYRCFWTLAGANAGAAVSARAAALGRPPAEDEIEPATRAVIARARGLTAEDYARALQGMHAIGRAMGAFLARFDVCVTPVYARPPLPVGSMSMRTADFAEYDAMLKAERPFTAVHNASGTPAFSAPLGRTTDGLPIGVQAAAAYGRDDLLFALAGELERAMPWAHLRPPAPTPAGPAR